MPIRQSGCRGLLKEHAGAGFSGAPYCLAPYPTLLSIDPRLGRGRIT